LTALGRCLPQEVLATLRTFAAEHPDIALTVGLVAARIGAAHVSIETGELDDLDILTFWLHEDANADVDVLAEWLNDACEGPRAAAFLALALLDCWDASLEMWVRQGLASPDRLVQEAAIALMGKLDAPTFQLTDESAREHPGLIGISFPQLVQRLQSNNVTAVITAADTLASTAGPEAVIPLLRAERRWKDTAVLQVVRRALLHVNARYF
jgi:hypothetical protein